MAETYMITAKTVEEAIAIANREYADETHEVSYEIIEMPKKGFLGIGAKDAKIKVTVTKTVSLDSIVADLRSLKVFTDKGEGAEKSGRQNEKKSQNQQKKAAPQQNGEKNEKQANVQKQQKQNQPKSEKPAQNANQKPEKQANSQKSEQPKVQNQQKNDGVKAEKQANAQKPEKQANSQKAPQQKHEEQPVQNEAPKAEKIEKPVQPVQEKPEVKESVPAEAKSEKRGSLNNQGKPQRRQYQKPNAEQNIEASAVAVSAPMGLSDFVPSESASSFGSASAETKSSGRMSNDIRKSKKNQPKKEAKPENAQKTSDKGEKVIYEDRKSMITRYDVAESDDDYRKLDSLEDREMTIDEIRESVKPHAASAEEVLPEIEVPAPAKRREAVSEAEMVFALEFANTLLGNMGLEAKAVRAECPEGEEFDLKEGCDVYPKIDIIGDDTGILIGHHGETLDAIQYLVNLSALRKSKQKDGDYVKIVVDIENYREKREETLRTLARRMAAKAVKYKRNVFLEPMNAYERRIIHSELQNVENVSTHSVGTDRDRKIIITYEGADKAPENKSRRRRGNGRNHGENHGAEAVKAEVQSNEESSEKPQNSGSGRDRRRPKKVQKMPIEKIGDILPDSEGTSSDSAPVEG